MLYVGLVRPRKNIKNLLIAVQRLHNRFHHPFKLVMAGPLDDRFIDIPKEARNLGISNRIIQTGYIADEELLALYKHASMLLLPSLLEGFGLPILEGMASGVPVIASDIPPHREVASDAALLVPPDDPDSISEAMLQLFTNPRLASFLVAKGYDRVKNFSWEKCAQSTFNLYEELLL